MSIAKTNRKPKVPTVYLIDKKNRVRGFPEHTARFMLNTAAKSTREMSSGTGGTLHRWARDGWRAMTPQEVELWEEQGNPSRLSLAGSVGALLGKDNSQGIADLEAKNAELLARLAKLEAAQSQMQPVPVEEPEPAEEAPAAKAPAKKPARKRTPAKKGVAK